MATNKQRRLLTETELLTIVESNESELFRAEEQLGEIAGRVFDGIYEPGMFAQLVQEKKFEASTAVHAGEPIFVMLHTRNALGWLTIEGVASLKKSSMRFLVDAAEGIARHYGCPVIQFVTKLRALFRYGLEHHYKPVGVIMCKNALLV
jgi:hypothetical protein